MKKCHASFNKQPKLWIRAQSWDILPHMKKLMSILLLSLVSQAVFAFTVGDSVGAADDKKCTVPELCVYSKDDKCTVPELCVFDISLSADKKCTVPELCFHTEEDVISRLGVDLARNLRWACPMVDLNTGKVYLSYGQSNQEAYENGLKTCDGKGHSCQFIDECSFQ